MKAGTTLTALAAEIERQAKNKVDFVTPTDRLSVTSVGDELQLNTPVGNFGIEDTAHQQIASYLQIPKQYYDKCRELKPGLLAHNVNVWLADNPEPRMVRTLDGKARALLSDKYRPLENLDLAEAVLPVLAKLDVEIMSCQITERRLYVKAVDKKLARDVPSGRKMGDGSHVFFDTMSPAIVISNSEIGMGALSIESGVWTKVCTNLAIAKQRSMRRYHVGRRHEIADAGESIFALLTDSTRRLTDQALWAQVQDVVRAAFDQAKFAALCDAAGTLSEQPITGNPVAVVSFAVKRFGLTEAEGSSVLRHLVNGGDLSAYGLAASLSRSAEDVEDYDRATQVERVSGELLELPKSDWQEMLEAA